MVLTAQAMNVDAEIVTAFHVMRIALIEAIDSRRVRDLQTPRDLARRGHNREKEGEFMRLTRSRSFPADGIGTEVINPGCEVLETVAPRRWRFGFEFTHFDWGSDYYRTHGVMMPADGVDRIRDFDAIYFGAVGDPKIPDAVTLWGLRLAICQGIDQYANVRPTRLLPGLTGPLRAELGRETSTG